MVELPLLCTASGGYDATAGSPAGSLATKTEIPLNLIGAFKSEVVATSPTFTAVGTGVGTAGFSRAFSPGGLIGLNPQFVYTANLVDKSAGSTKQKIASETIEGEVPFATKTGSVALTAGHVYQVEIEATTSSSLASIGLLGGEAIGRFDNVVVVGPDATPEEKPKDGENGTNGENGSNGSGGTNGSNGTGTNGTDGRDGTNGTNGGNGEGAGGVSSARLESLMQSSVTGPVTLHGSRLSVKARCPAKAGATCTISLQGMLTRKKAATAGRKAKVKKAKTKNFALTVKPAARATVKTKQKLLFKETLKVGHSKATVYRSLKLIRR